MIKHLIIGLRMVGSSFFRLMKAQSCFLRNSFFCIDANPNSKALFEEMGGNPDHFLCVRVTKENYQNLLCGYNPGDYIFDFSCEVKNIDMLIYALEKDLHYISTSDSNWNLDDPSWISAHQHFLEYRKIRKGRYKGRSTSLIEFGMNPGLVSCYAKKCLKMIIETDENPFIVSHRKNLLELLNKKKYGVVAKKIGLKYVIEVDHDNQVFNIQSKNDDAIYSPWNPLSFFHESLSAPEVIFGDWKQFKQFDEVRDCDFGDLYISLLKSGCDYKEQVFSPQGEINGSLVTHEEVFSMSYFFKCGFYKPTSFFVYKPCELAEQSVLTNRANNNPAYIILDRNSWKCGGESVGVILQGERFHSTYYGNYLECASINETATIRQVSASSFAAYMYIKNHPYEGFLFPEEVDEEELLELTQPFLGENIYTRCESVSPRFGKE